MAILIIYFIRNKQVWIVKEITLQKSRYDFWGNDNVGMTCLFEKNQDTILEGTSMCITIHVNEVPT